MEQEILDRIEILQGDITRLDVDAIVNAANTSLLGGGGVDGAIHRAAGPELLEECRAVGGCPTGEARITGGYNLPARNVIHTVGPVYSGKAEDGRLLSQCYANSLHLAVRHHLTSIAFPSISCGVYGYPIKKACRIAMDTTCSFLRGNSGIAKIIFVVFSSENFETYSEYFRKLAAE
ncbi:O-acetyl-ADP-ribose deacetylase [Thermodesulfobacteriota bacterium]